MRQRPLLLTFFITSVSMTWKTFQGSHTVRYWVRKGARSKLRVSEAPPLASRSNLQHNAEENVYIGGHIGTIEVKEVS